MRNASSKNVAKKAPFNNNLSTQTNDVMVNPRNPENPDSNNWLLRAICPMKTGEAVIGFWGMFPVINFLIRIYRIFRIKEDVFGLKVKVICSWSTVS